MYEIFEELLRVNNQRPADVAKATGISPSVLSDWKNKKGSPKLETLKRIADHFHLDVGYFISADGKLPKEYYIQAETAQMAQSLFDDPDMRILFDAAKGSKAEDLQMAANLLKRLKGAD